MLESKSKDELIELVKYYKSEWNNVCMSLRQKNKDITKLKTEITSLKKRVDELDNELANNKIEFLF